MSWFKRKEDYSIPPVEQVSPRPPSYRTDSSTYNASRDGDVYSKSSPAISRYSSQTSDREYTPPARKDFSRSQGITDPYSRGERNLNADRNALFAGYDAEKASGLNKFTDGPPGRRTPPPGEEEDEDVEGIKQQTRYTKQESVNSTRNALRMAREAEETARNTLGRLGDQSEKIANSERHLDAAKGHSMRAEDNAIEIKKLNRSIFIPAITLDKKGKRAAQESKRQQRLDEEREEREKAMMDIRDSSNRLGRITTYGQDGGDDDGEGIGGFGRRRVKTESEQNIRKEQRKRFQFEATGSDDELEDELDDNLDEISDMTKRLKALGSTMGQELDKQNERLQRIDGKTSKLDDKIVANTDRLKRIR